MGDTTNLLDEWMREALQLPLPQEANTTCDDCPMCPSEAQPASVERFFEPSTKCCTFLPSIPNFLVGRMLADDSVAAAAGRETVVDRIAARSAVTPLGLGRSLAYSLRYRHDRNAFGQKSVLRCPHYLVEQGQCGIWRNRNSVCSTWFCKHERGNAGLRLWTSVRDFLFSVEAALAGWCALQLGMDNPAVRELYEQREPSLRRSTGVLSHHLIAGQLEERPNRAILGRGSLQRHQALWLSRAGEEEQFYLQCAQLVDNFSWTNVQRVVGPVVQGDLEAAQAAQAAYMNPTIPDRLIRGALEVLAQVIHHGHGLQPRLTSTVA